ncbi:MAG TPA: hypothetical protein VK029_04695 [Pseudogracilibacillus sp.]|nr:hypothetical protein [Pseudogracilibacillus sp.]
MESFIAILSIVLVFLIIGYAIFSIYLRKPVGLFIAAILHVVLGILSLPSIGLYILGLAALELIAGITLAIRKQTA